MRVRLSTTALATLFNSIPRSLLRVIARECSVSSRTVRAWESGDSTIPHDSFSMILSHTKLALSDLNPSLIDDYWYAKKAAKLGGRARYALYGNPGTELGRKKGGLISVESHKKLNTDFQTLKKVNLPKHSKYLAEILGIVFGDGHLSTYQLLITTNSITDLEHANYVKKILEDVFNTNVSLKKKRSQNALNIVLSSKTVVSFIHLLGMPKGNKLDLGLNIPQWVKENSLYSRYFIRGLFDTDGCIYLDRHRVKTKVYASVGWAITSYSTTLIHDIKNLLVSFGFNPTNTSKQKSVYLRRKKEIIKYFELIGTSNKKHRDRFEDFNGRVRRMVRHRSRKAELRKGFVGSSPTSSALKNGKD